MQPNGRTRRVLEAFRPVFENDDIPPQFELKWWYRERFEEIADLCGLEFLGAGSCRVTLALSHSRVLKVGYSPHGMQANRLEAEAAGRLPRVLHARVFACAEDGLWLVQERVEPLNGRQWRQNYAEIDRIRQQTWEAVGKCPTDTHLRNLGRRANGQVVLVDLEDLGRLPPGEVFISRISGRRPRGRLKHWPAGISRTGTSAAAGE